MLNRATVLIFALSTVLFSMGCGQAARTTSVTAQTVTILSEENNDAVIISPNGGTIVNLEEEKALGSICSWDWGLGIGGIFTSLSEYQSFVQNKVNAGVITHCVAVNGEMLRLTPTSNGLFGPCIGAISQNMASFSTWSSCASHIQ